MTIPSACKIVSPVGPCRELVFKSSLLKTLQCHQYEAPTSHNAQDGPVTHVPASPPTNPSPKGFS